MIGRLIRERVWRRAVCASVISAGVLVDASPRQAVSVGAVVNDTRLRLAVDRMLYDRWYPPKSIPQMPPRPDDRGMLTAALASANPVLRATAVQLVGRFEDPADEDTLRRFAADADPTVRRNAVEAIARVVVRISPARAGLTAQFLEARFGQERDPDVQAAILASIGALAYSGPAFPAVQGFLASNMQLGPDRLPADQLSTARLHALRRLFERNPGQPITETVHRLLLDMAKPSAASAPLEDAMFALLASGAGTNEVALNAIRYRCTYVSPGPGRALAASACLKDGGGRIRELGMRMLDARDAEAARSLKQLLDDPMVESALKILAVDALARSGQSAAFNCDALVLGLDRSSADAAASDNGPQAVLDALSTIDLLSPACTNADHVAEVLNALAASLGSSSRNGVWQVPARALVRLAQFRPAAVKQLLHDTAARHDVWQVRVAAADAAQVIGDQELLLTLTRDANVNVRTEALSALARLHSGLLAPAAIDALSSDDNQLIVVAAVCLRGVTTPEAIAALLEAFRRLSAEARDGSQGPRLEILGRLRDFSLPDRAGSRRLFDATALLEPGLRDFDPIVAVATADLLFAITGTRPEPRPTYRPPQQPTEAELDGIRTLPPLYLDVVHMGGSDSTPVETHAALELDTGARINLRFALSDAPVAVARFLELAQAGYYDGQVVYRRTSTEILTGSPDANDYSGERRYWRDEIGGAAVENDVALLTHGRNTGDGRFLIALSDRPALQDTVFAHVVGDLPPILEGTRIVKVLAPPVTLH